MPSSNPVLAARARVAGLQRRSVRAPDPEVLAAAQRELTVLVLERAIKRANGAEPAMLPEQRGYLIELLRRGVK